jgi:RimJ/RimL family protein N-acetyltransferase
MINPKVTLCDIETVSQFLIQHPQINTQYSDMFNQYFPYVKNPFYKSLDELHLHEKIFREKMINALIKSDIHSKYSNIGIFDMKKYYLYLKDVLPYYNITNIYIIILINKNMNKESKISVNDRLIGCATVSKHKNNIDLMLSDVCIVKDCQNKGYGKIITKLAIDLAKKIKNNTTYKKLSLSVDKTNEKAINCYKKVGFKITNENYSETDILMEYLI